MSTLSLEDLNILKLKDTLRNNLKCSTITTLKKLPSAVNTTLLVKTNNKTYVMKILTTPPTSPCEIFRLEKEAELLQYYSNNQRVPVPKLIFSESNEKIIGYRYIITEFVEGENLTEIWKTLPFKEKETLLKQLARIVQEIHSRKYNYFGDLEDCSEASRYICYREMLMNDIHDLTMKLIQLQKYSKELLFKVRDTFLAKLKFLDLCPEPTLAHNDIHQGNIIVQRSNETGYKIIAILDWEWAAASSPLSDLLYIKQTMLEDESLAQLFFTTYSKGAFTNLKQHKLEQELNELLWTLDDAACGWLFHNPTTEGEDRFKAKLHSFIE